MGKNYWKPGEFFTAADWNNDIIKPFRSLVTAEHRKLILSDMTNSALIKVYITLKAAVSGVFPMLCPYDIPSISNLEKLKTLEATTDQTIYLGHRYKLIRMMKESIVLVRGNNSEDAANATFEDVEWQANQRK